MFQVTQYSIRIEKLFNPYRKIDEGLEEGDVHPHDCGVEGRRGHRDEHAPEAAAGTAREGGTL